MINWFEIIVDRLTAIEKGQDELRTRLSPSLPSQDPNPYADFNWLCTTCAGVPPSTLRIKSAAGEIPGVIKIGKRVLYEKASVLNWLRSQHVVIPSSEQIEQEANSQIDRVLSKRSKKGGGESV